MQTIQINIPDSILRNLKKLAKKDQISIDQFVTTAVSEKISAFMTRDYLKKKAARGSKEKFMESLARVPDIEPGEYDRL